MVTREDEFTRVRELLGWPKHQKPSPHEIFAELFRQEQRQKARIQNVGKPLDVAPSTTTVTTVAGTSEYVLSPADFSKALYVYREIDTSSSDITIMPVAMTDFLNEPNSQKYEMWVAPIGANLYPMYTGAKVAFFRTSDGKRKMRIFPVPDASGVVYTILYSNGPLDVYGTADTDSVNLPEWSDLRCMRAALFKLPMAEWEGFAPAENFERRKELRDSLGMQMAEQMDEFEQWIRNPQNESVTEVLPYYA